MYGKGGKDEMRAVTFGEIMLRLSPCGYKRLVQADCFEAVYGGAEANVAVSLAQFGCDSVYVTRLPQNDLAKACRVNLQKWGVDTSKIVFGGDRVGIYYMEKGISQRPSNVIYDRAGSAFAMSEANDYDFEKILDGADWFHFTGITAALGDKLTEALRTACRIAKKKGITISCDLNYRSKLWTKEKAAVVMAPLLEMSDVCIANESQAEEVFSIESDLPESSERSRETAEKLLKKFNFKVLAFTERRTINANRNKIFGLIYDGKEFAHSREYTMDMVDRVGGGDAFAAGMIYALSQKYTLSDSIGFAVAASVLKHSVEGDFNIVSVDEIQRLMRNGENGRVQR